MMCPKYVINQSLEARIANNTTKWNIIVPTRKNCQVKGKDKR